MHSADDEQDQEQQRREDELEHHRLANLKEQRARIKRFSSALCLNEGACSPTSAAPQPERTSAKDRQLAAHHRRPQAPDSQDTPHSDQHKARAAGRETGAPTSAQKGQPADKISRCHLLAPEDPVVALARQRRPSATNQASVNLDQQGG